MRWIRTGFGRPRPVFVCPRCGRRIIKVHDHTGGLACKRCHNAIQLSQKLDKRTRPILKAHRLEQFLALKSNINQRTRERLLKRFGEKAMRPQSSYRTRGPAHWK